jgi:hypothetical protein
MPVLRTVTALVRAPKAPGLRHMEILAGMRLGAPVVSLHRMQLHRVAVFAEWDDEAALQSFLTQHPFGRKLVAGWHVRLEFVRRWGSVREFLERGEPVVAVTLARMRLPQLPRFIRWGRPVESQVRDHPETTRAVRARLLGGADELRSLAVTRRRPRRGIPACVNNVTRYTVGA